MRPEKTQQVRDIRALMESSPSLFLMGYKGLTAAEFRALRSALAVCGSQCHVVPNRLLKIAAAESGLAELGQAEVRLDTALVSGGADAVAVARALRDFAKTHEEAVLKMAVIERKLCTGAQAAALADLPPRQVLQAQLLGLLQAPAGRLLGVLNAKAASVVHVLNAYLSQKQKAA
jgi:large subunit ribosomal protein L10